MKHCLTWKEYDLIMERGSGEGTVYDIIWEMSDDTKEWEILLIITLR